MFFSWNKIILILYNLQADQDQKRAFFTEIGLSYIQFICFVWSLITKWKKKALCLSVNVFSTKVLIGSTILTCST